jgi:hypothetical protein
VHIQHLFKLLLILGDGEKVGTGPLFALCNLQKTVQKTHFKGGRSKVTLMIGVTDSTKKHVSLTRRGRSSPKVD